jgi:hypothetical protein
VFKTGRFERNPEKSHQTSSVDAGSDLTAFVRTRFLDANRCPLRSKTLSIF